MTYHRDESHRAEGVYLASQISMDLNNFSTAWKSSNHPYILSISRIPKKYGRKWIPTAD